MSATSHAQDRAFERYGLTLSVAEIRDMEARVRASDPTTILLRYTHNSHSRAVVVIRHEGGVAAGGVRPPGRAGRDGAAGACAGAVPAGVGDGGKAVGWRGGTGGMTVYVMYLRCDGRCGASIEHDFVADRQGVKHSNAALLRESAVKHGWKLTNARDLCPECAAKVDATKGDTPKVETPKLDAPPARAPLPGQLELFAEARP